MNKNNIKLNFVEIKTYLHLNKQYIYSNESYKLKFVKEFFFLVLGGGKQNFREIGAIFNFWQISKLSRAKSSGR